MLAVLGALVLSPAATAAAAPGPPCCVFRLDGLPESVVAGGAPGQFSGAMINETDDRTFTRTEFVLTVRLAGLVAERVRVERADDDADWITLPADSPSAGSVRVVDRAHATVAIKPGTVAGGRYRVTFAANAPTGNAGLTIEAHPMDGPGAGVALGRSSTYLVAVLPPGPEPASPTATEPAGDLASRPADSPAAAAPVATRLPPGAEPASSTSAVAARRLRTLVAVAVGIALIVVIIISVTRLVRRRTWG